MYSILPCPSFEYTRELELQQLSRKSIPSEDHQNRLGKSSRW